MRTGSRKFMKLEKKKQAERLFHHSCTYNGSLNN